MTPRRNLLFDEPPLRVSASIACLVVGQRADGSPEILGLECATFLQQLHELSYEWRRDGGTSAVTFSMVELRRRMPYFSVQTMRRLVATLRGVRIIEVGTVKVEQGRVTAYRIDYELLYKLVDSAADPVTEPPNISGDLLESTDGGLLKSTDPFVEINRPPTLSGSLRTIKNNLPNGRLAGQAADGSPADPAAQALNTTQPAAKAAAPRAHRKAAGQREPTAGEQAAAAELCRLVDVLRVNGRSCMHARNPATLAAGLARANLPAAAVEVLPEALRRYAGERWGQDKLLNMALWCTKAARQWIQCSNDYAASLEKEPGWGAGRGARVPAEAGSGARQALIEEEAAERAELSRQLQEWGGRGIFPPDELAGDPDGLRRWIFEERARERHKAEGRRAEGGGEEGPRRRAEVA